jgi:hypothetical protein
MTSLHRLTVDAYAAQHPGTEERRTIQSVWVHLLGLHLILEQGFGNDLAIKAMGALSNRSGALVWLAPPSTLGPITLTNVVDAHGASEHEDAVRSWARSVWEAWKPHHETIQTISSEMLAAGGRR